MKNVNVLINTLYYAGNTFSVFRNVFCQVFKVFNLLLDLSGQQLISGWPNRAS